MAKTNKKAIDKRFDPDKDNALAGGAGLLSAKQSPEALLRRSVMACLLFEDLAYAKGSTIAGEIKRLVHQVNLHTVAEIAIEARMVQKLRHVPLLLVREMARHQQLSNYPGLVRDTLAQVIQRPDEMTEFLSMYWSEGKTPLSAQVKKGLAIAFAKFNEYQLQKYNRNETVKLRDVLFMSHVKATDIAKDDLYKRLINNQLAIPNTWETRLSAGENKGQVFTDMIIENQLGALAFLRNLRNMVDAGVSATVIRQGFANLNPKWLLPVNYLAAVQAAPRYEPEIENLMLAGFQQVTKLPGHTVFVIDHSGSMNVSISTKSTLTRREVANAMAMVAEATCESVAIFVTAGNDKHVTKLVTSHNGIVNGSGFALIKRINEVGRECGTNGIFTRQCLEYILACYTGQEQPDRIIVFSDSQDCDHVNKIPKPFGKRNYIVDVSAHTHGVNYDGVWTAEIAGWSNFFIDYIAALEGVSWQQDDKE